jgi:polyribonucleotide nucleotidyltransferase
MPFVRETATVGGKEITIETGKWAKQAGGSVIIRCGESMVLVTATGSALPRDIDFMPLTCEYQEKFYSSGKIPGSFFRREGRTTTEEILVCRLMDRPIRPLFPKGWFIDTQIIANVISFDKENATDVLAMTGASAALHLSDLVFDGPIAGIRVARIDGAFVANPSFAEREKSDMDIIVACSKDAITMVEGEMEELSENVVIDALLFAHEAAQPLIQLQERLRAAAGKAKREFAPPVADETLAARAKELAWSKLGEAMQIKDKKARGRAVSDAKGAAMTALTAEGQPWFGKAKEVEAALGKLQKKWARGHTLSTRTRKIGRASCRERVS